MIILDLCGTLYDSNTTMEFIKFIHPKRYILIRNPFFRILGKISHSLGFDLIRFCCIKTLSGYKKETLLKIAEEFFEKKLKHQKIDFTHIKLNEFKKQNQEIMILSATIDPIAEVVAKRLEVKFLSSKLEYNYDNKCTGKLKKDLLGRKHLHINKNIETIITDNKDDLEIIKLSQKSIIISKPKDISFWERNHQPNMTIIRL